MNTLVASPGRQFVRSPGFQRLAVQGLFDMECQTLSFQRLSAAGVQELIYGVAAVPFSIIPNRLDPPVSGDIFQDPKYMTYWDIETENPFNHPIGSNPNAAGQPNPWPTVEMDACFTSETPIWFVNFGQYPARLETIVLRSQALLFGLVSYYAATVPYVYIGGTIGPYQWYGRRSRIRSSQNVSAFLARCTMRQIQPVPGGPFQFQHLIENVRLKSQFTLAAFDWYEIPLAFDDQGGLVENEGQFVVVGESPAQWSARTGISIIP